MYSIRWRLPLSYTAVTLIAILTLGAAMLLTLQQRYAAEEVRYLEENVRAVGRTLETLWISEDQFTEENRTNSLQTYVDTYALITQTQVTIKDTAGDIIVTSNDPATIRAQTTLSLEVRQGETVQQYAQTVDLQSETAEIISYVTLEDGSLRYGSEESFSVSQDQLNAVGEGAISPLFLFDLSTEQRGLGLEAEDSVRSTHVARYELSRQNGIAHGTIEMTAGPAFGQVVIENVTLSLIFGGLIALVTAFSVGWLVSRRLTVPLAELVLTTEQMAAGDLQARSRLNANDEIGQLARSFNVMAGQIEATVTALKQFVADAAHELNTPLTALRTQLELAFAKDDNQSHVSDALRQAARLEQLNDNLLRLTRLEGNPNEFAHRPVSFTKLINRHIEAYAARAEQSNIALQLTIPQDPLMLRGDETQLTQLIDNLTDNALKFTPAGGTVQLKLANSNNMVQLTIVDDGIGIPPADQPSLFDRFHRAANALPYRGSGLGLAIVARIVDQHQGSISLVSNEGRGTTVSINLPSIAPSTV